MRRLREEAFQGEIGNIKDSELGEKEKAEAIADATAKYLETLSTIDNAQSFEENKDSHGRKAQTKAASEESGMTTSHTKIMSLNSTNLVSPPPRTIPVRADIW